MPLKLSDAGLAVVTAVAGRLPCRLRGAFLQELAAAVAGDEGQGLRKIAVEAAKRVVRIEAAEKLGAVLADVLPCYLSNVQRASGCVQARDVTLESIFLEGHADSSGSIQKNWDLSVNRAVATYRDLDADPSGVTKLDNPSGDRLFSVSGYGHFRPVATNDTPAGRAANRRIDLRFNMQIDQSRALNEIRGELRRVLDRR